MSEEVPCYRLYTAQFDCCKRSWTVSGGSLSCGEPGTDAWIGGACSKTFKYSCRPQDSCPVTPPPSPPTEEGTCCQYRCLWQFVKKFDCNTLSWKCVSAALFCLPPAESDWIINPETCTATILLNLDIPCGEGGGCCPSPSCSQAPGGPFLILEGCCND